MEGSSDSSLIAMGKAGGFAVEVLSRQGIWSMSVESPSWCFDFVLTSPNTVTELCGFLRSHADRTEFAELVVGSFGGVVVRVVKDDEFADRFFLRAAGAGSLVEFTLAGKSERDFADAVAQATAELAAES